MRCCSRRICLATLLFLSVTSLPSCLVRRRVVKPPGKHENRPLLTATKEQLIQEIHAIYDPIQSFAAKVDMAPSVGSLYGGQVTDYATITAFILFQRPDSIRVIGQDPVIHSTLFDMVSVGNDFRVSIPTKSLFLKGENSAPATSQNKLENLRPVAFLTSLIINPPDPQNDVTLMEDDTDQSKAVYIIFIVQRQQDQLRLVRAVYFDRYTLQIARQKTFDGSGTTTSQTIYSDWKNYSGVEFPSSIDIQRPQDGYEVVLSVLNMKINTAEVAPAKFVLNQPPNAHVKELK